MAWVRVTVNCKGCNMLLHLTAPTYRLGTNEAGEYEIGIDLRIVQLGLRAHSKSHQRG